jgi:hypothetical protein
MVVPRIHQVDHKQILRHHRWMQQQAPQIHVYEVHGVVIDDDRDEIVFPVDIIEAAAPELVLGVIADKAAWLKGWSNRFKLFEVPCRRESARPWCAGEMQLICDIELGIQT